MIYIQAIRQFLLFLATLLTLSSTALPLEAYAHEQNSGHWGALVVSPNGTPCFSRLAHSSDEAIRALQEIIWCSGETAVTGQGWGALYMTVSGAWGANFAKTRDEAETGALRVCNGVSQGEECLRVLVFYTSADEAYYDYGRDNPQPLPATTYYPPSRPPGSYAPSRTECERIYSHDPLDNC